MAVIQLIYLVVTYAVWAIIFAAIILMLVRMLMTYMDVNPFSSSALTMRRLSDSLARKRRTRAALAVICSRSA